MKSRIVFELGDLRYELHNSWLRKPSMLPSMQVAAVACAPDDCLYVVTRNHEHPILAFDPDGCYMGTIGAELNFGSEHGLSFAPDGCLWVCDSDRHVAYKLTRNGEVVMILGNLDKPCDNGFDPAVPYPYNLYTINRAGEPFNRPTGVVETEDAIWACDGYGNTSVHRFDKQGKLELTFGGPGSDPDKFRLPHAIWIDRKNRVWIADRDNHRIELYDRDGGLIRCFDPIYPIGTPYGPSTLWGDDQFIYCCQNSRGIAIYDQETLDMSLLEAPITSGIMGHSMCGDSQGSLYIGHLNPEPMVTKLERIR